MLAVHADRMDLVEVGQRVILVGEVADRGDRRDVAVHRIDAFERDQLGRLGIFGGEQLLEMLEVVVPEHALLAAAEFLMPAIIEAWLSSSEKITQPGSSLPSVDSAASLET